MADFYTVVDGYFEQHATMPDSALKFDFRNMVKGYCVAALWSSFDLAESDRDNPQHFDDNGFTIHDFDQQALEGMARNCWKFWLANIDDVTAFSKVHSFEQIGHSFWLNHNGHGAVFFDFANTEPHILGFNDLCDRLSEASRRYSEINLYSDNGKIYV